jgi:hypothetical protein
MSGEARYSQPIEPTPRDVGGPVLRVGFIGKGANKRIGFLFLNPKGRVTNVEVTRENRANEHPRGFFSSLAQLWASGGKP